MKCKCGIAFHVAECIGPSMSFARPTHHCHLICPLTHRPLKHWGILSRMTIWLCLYLKSWTIPNRTRVRGVCLLGLVVVIECDNDWELSFARPSCLLEYESGEYWTTTTTTTTTTTRLDQSQIGGWQCDINTITGIIFTHQQYSNAYPCWLHLCALASPINQVAADGPSSIVKSQLNFPSWGWSYNQRSE